LRMGTTGCTAQAAGAGDEAEVRATLGRALLVGAVLGLGLILLQGPLATLALALLEGSADVEATTAAYFAIRIWGAPATVAFLVAWWGLASVFGNTGLWWAFLVYVCVRALALAAYYPGLLRSAGP
ncbi:MAG: hypothetical protein KDI01_08010, partial [Halioglobus sp.]|nr:hypothetical protein [Halioglobus sp.]